jgi:hypothetical protein
MFPIKSIPPRPSHVVLKELVVSWILVSTATCRLPQRGRVGMAGTITHLLTCSHACSSTAAGCTGWHAGALREFDTLGGQASMQMQLRPQYAGAVSLAYRHAF